MYGNERKRASAGNQIGDSVFLLDSICNCYDNGYYFHNFDVADQDVYTGGLYCIYKNTNSCLSALYGNTVLGNQIFGELYY